jgi:soluble lytic murein transglycosylase-like protein
MYNERRMNQPEGPIPSTSVIPERTQQVELRLPAAGRVPGRLESQRRERVRRRAHARRNRSDETSREITRRRLLTLGAAGAVTALAAIILNSPKRPRDDTSAAEKPHEGNATAENSPIQPVEVITLPSNPLEPIFKTASTPELKKKASDAINKYVNPPIYSPEWWISRDEADERTIKLKPKVQRVLQDNPNIFGDKKNDDLFVNQVLAIIEVESSGIFHPQEEVGGVGYTQVEKPVVEDFKKEFGIDADPNIEDQNILLGAYYLKKNFDRSSGDFIKATAMYHNGPGVIIRGESKHPKGDRATYEELLEDPISNNEMRYAATYIAKDPQRLENVYRYPAALIRMFYKNEFKEIR